jgi:hypothetical protein
MSLGPDVRVRLSAEGEAQVVNALRRVAGEAQRSGRAASRGFGQFNTALSGARTLLAQVAAVVSVGVFINIAKQAASAADEIGKMSQRVGASVENLSALSLVAKTSDVDMATLTKTMIALTRRVSELQGGSKEAARDFGALGLSARDFKGKDAAQQVDVVAAAFERLRDSPEKTALGFRIFGRQVGAVIPLLNSLAGEGGLQGAITRARELGVLLSEDTARAAQAINDDLTIIKEQVMAGAARFVEGLAPAIHAVFGDIQEDLGNNQDAWKEWGESVGQVVGLLVLSAGSLLDRLLTSVKKITNALGALGQAVVAIFQGQFAQAVLIERDARSRGEALEADFQKREEERRARAERLGAAAARGASSLPALRSGTGDAEAPTIPDDAAQRALEAERKRLEAAKERARIENAQRLAKAGEVAAERALLGFDALRSQVQKEVNAGILTEAEGRAKVQQAARDLLAELEATRNRYLALSVINPFDPQAAAMVAGLTEQIARLNEELDAVPTVLQQVRTTAKEAFQDALVNALTTGLQEAENLLGVLRNIGLAVVQAVQQLLALRLAKAIVGGLPFSGGGQVPVRKATGGAVSGPGTGTSDSVPAMLSRGEYVVRAAVVQQPGVLGALEALNRGMATPALAGPRGVRRFADGGFVSGAGVQRHDVSVTLGLEDGLVERRIESPAGSRAVVRVVSKNRRAVGSALGG